MKRRARYWGMSILFIVMLAAAVQASYQYPTTNDRVDFIEDHWLYEKDTDWLPVRPGYKVKADAGEPVRILNQLPEKIGPVDILCFRTDEQSVRVWIDGTMIYSYGTQEDGWLTWEHRDRGMTLKSPPGKWHRIDLTTEMAGKKLLIETVSPYRVFSCQAYRIMTGSEGQIQNHLLSVYGVPFLLQLMLGIIGAAMYAFSLFIEKQSQDKSYRRHMGLFVVIAALWSCGNSQVPIPLWPVSGRELAVCALMAGPLPMILYLMEDAGNERERLFLKVLLWYAGISAGICLILQYFHIKDLLEVISAFHVTVGITVIAAVWIEVKDKAAKIRKLCFTIYEAMEMTGLTALIATICMELYAFYGPRTLNSGFMVRTGLTLFVLSLCACNSHKAVDSMKRSKQFLLELERSRTKMLLSQIQPHFLYNTLLSIQHLCYTQPRKAADTIVMFSAYLRENMNFLEQEPLIPSWVEYRHVKNYIEIQKIRFGEDLAVETDLRAKGFMIPLLTIQPLVENAIVHGIRKRPGAGIIRISAWKEGEWILITVEDNGAGFDVTRKHGKGTFSAMENVSQRLKMLLDGDMNVESASGEGTRVTLRFRYRRAVEECV